VTIAAYGTAVIRALEAATALAEQGIAADVLDMVSLKPLDDALLLESVRRTGRLVTVEDHNVIGGLAGAVAQTLLDARLAPAYRRLGVRDVFTESGAAGELRDEYGVGTASIIAAAREIGEMTDMAPAVEVGA
jgi:transketolase